MSCSRAAVRDLVDGDDDVVFGGQANGARIGHGFHLWSAS
jgi:hypothetical protein